jgi:hypothetical protein
MGQYAVQISSGALGWVGTYHCAYTLEKCDAGLTVIQIADGFSLDNTLIVENIRALQAHVIQLSKTGDCSLLSLGHFGDHLLAKPEMRINGWHNSPSFAYFSLFYIIFVAKKRVFCNIFKNGVKAAAFYDKI